MGINVYRFCLLMGMITAKARFTITEREARIYYSEGEWSIVDKEFPLEQAFVAQGFYSFSQMENGWNTLAITTNSAFPDEVQAEGAGRLEAYLTRDEIYNHYLNANSSNGIFTEEMKQFFRDQEAWVKKSRADKPNDPHIFNAFLLLLQFNGLRQQYNSMQSEKQIDNIDFYIINAFGDIFDINEKFNPKNFQSMTLEQFANHFIVNSHCSALFKAKEDLSDVFISHNSWVHYSMMTRIFKEYNFNFNHPSVKAKNILFSSYPGCLTSNDDFFITSKDIAVIETSNNVYDKELYKLIEPSSLLCWQRTMIANRMSSTASDWIDNFVKYNSGTYNNMFMALDMKLVDLENRRIHPDAMYITDQIPGYTSKIEVTDQLRLGYWPSYNTPYSKEVIKRSKIQEMIEKKPGSEDFLDYDLCTRATIFRRDQGAVTDVDSMKKLIRSNNYLNDPLTKGDPSNALSARNELRTKSSCGGAYDAKVASVKELKGPKKTIHMIAGPTQDQVKPFVWSEVDACKSFTNHGLPDAWNFDWITYINRFPME